MQNAFEVSRIILALYSHYNLEDTLLVFSLLKCQNTVLSISHIRTLQTIFVVWNGLALVGFGSALKEHETRACEIVREQA